VVNAPLESVLHALTDVRRYPKWVPTMQRSRVLAEGNNSVVMRTLARLPWPVGDITETVRLETRPTEDGFTIYWRHLSGDLRQNSGRWQLRPVSATKTELRYFARFQLNMWLPTFIVRWAQQKQTPKALSGLQQQARAHWLAQLRERTRGDQYRKTACAPRCSGRTDSERGSSRRLPVGSEQG
jgi:ribosome-associated toxin RatA of RatAB toxin-antitoxin module